MTKPLKVFIAEDESMILFGFKSYLLNLGHEVIGEAYDGEMAVSMLETLEPDLLIMDVKMPRLDGIQALEKINHARKTILPCVFITAHSDDALIRRAKDAGAFSYLIKPITIENLKAAIEIAIHRYHDFLNVQSELDDLKETLENRKTIERAKGYLMDNFNFKEQQAFEYMQKKSRETNKKLIVVAKSILKMDETLRNE